MRRSMQQIMMTVVGVPSRHHADESGTLRGKDGQGKERLNGIGSS